MAKEIITTEDLESFRLRLLEDLKQIVQQKTKFNQKEWLKSVEVRQLLGISHGTLQTLRTKGAIPYRKLGGIMFYRYQDVIAALETDPKIGQV